MDKPIADTSNTHRGRLAARVGLTRLLAIGMAVALSGVWLSPGHAQALEPVRIVFDTDISGDVDDVLALAMLHTLADRGECQLLGVTISKINPLTGPFTDAVNTFYGRPDVPLGVTRNAQRRSSKYLQLVEKRDGGKYRYPHDVTSNQDLPDAVGLLRRLLTHAPDRSVVVVQVGLATNLADLLKSQADEISPLSGVELVRQKVKLASVMAGAFEPAKSNARFLEANVRNGIAAMQYFAQRWPAEVPVVWSGYSIGIAVPYPRQSIARDFRYVQHHIVAEAYLLHSGPNHDRPTWDLTSVLHAVRPSDDFFALSPPGNVTVADDGFTQFRPNGQGRDRFLKMSPLQGVRVREALRFLVSQPPVAQGEGERG